MPTLVELDDLSRHYGRHVALDGLTLAIEQGELFALLGPSGCGKTTTLRLIAGFDAPTRGDVRLRGRSLNGLRPNERHVSTVFQNYALFPHLTARANIEFGLRYAKGETAPFGQIVEMLDLGEKLDRKPAELSGGERQRVALARSLILQPDVLLLDEPLSALDPNLRKQVRGELRELQRRIGTTFIFVTHDQEEALSMSDRMAVLHQGRLAQLGTPRELYRHPASRFVASFLGPVNWMDGVGVRPEATRLNEARTERGVEAMVESVTYLGNCLHVTARLANGNRVVAEVPARRAFAPEVPVWVEWDAADEIRVSEP